MPFPKVSWIRTRSRSVGAKAGVEAGQAAVETGRSEFGLHESRVVNRRNRPAINTVQVGNPGGGRRRSSPRFSQVSPIKVYFPISEQEYLRMAAGGGSGGAWTLSRMLHKSRCS